MSVVTGVYVRKISWEARRVVAVALVVAVAAGPTVLFATIVRCGATYLWVPFAM